MYLGPICDVEQALKKISEKSGGCRPRTAEGFAPKAIGEGVK